jgi:hypothetical protein
MVLKNIVSFSSKNKIKLDNLSKKADPRSDISPFFQYKIWLFKNKKKSDHLSIFVIFV